jgi:hypothetical protein
VDKLLFDPKKPIPAARRLELLAHKSNADAYSQVVAPNPNAKNFKKNALPQADLARVLAELDVRSDTGALACYFFAFSFW